MHVRRLLPCLLFLAPLGVACSEDEAPEPMPSVNGRGGSGGASNKGGAAGSFTSTGGTSAGGNGGTSAGGSGPSTSSWAKTFEGTADRYLVSLARVSGGGVVAMGFFEGTINLGGEALSSQGSFAGTEPAWSIFVARFDDGGGHVWSKRYGGPGVAKPQAVAVDAKGNVFIAGGFTNTISFGSTTLTSAGGTDAFIAALDDKGVAKWAYRYGDAGEQIANAVAVDSRGDVSFAGALAGAADFGGGALTSKGEDDVFVAKLSANGVYQWGQRFGEGGPQRAFGLAVDGGGNLVLSGTFAGALDFGGGALPNRGGRDVFVAKLGPKGEHRFSGSFGEGSDQLARAVAASEDGRIAIAGEFAGTVDFGPPRGDYALKEPPLPPLSTGGAGGAGGGAGAAGGGGKAGSAGAGGAGASGAAGAGGGAPVDPLAGDCNGTGYHFDSASGHCYFFSAEAKTWDQAHGLCAARGARWSLLAIGNAAEIDLVKAKFKFDAAWTGGTDTAKEGTFVWDNGEPWALPGGKAPWNDGEPNDGKGTVAEDCAEIVASGKLNDGDCTLAKAYVCERGSPWPLVSKGGTDGFVAVFDPKGQKLWDRSFGDGDDQRAWSVAFDANGGVAVGGDAVGTLDLGSGELSAGHAFLALYDEKGAPVWNARYGTGVGQTLALAVSNGRVFGGGAFSGSLDVGATKLDAGGRVSAFLLGRQ